MNLNSTHTRNIHCCRRQYICTRIYCSPIKIIQKINRKWLYLITLYLKDGEKRVFHYLSIEHGGVGFGMFSVK